MMKSEPILRLEGCTVDLSRGQVDRPDGPLSLTRIEGRLLAYLVDHADRPVPRDELLKEVWGYPGPVRTRTVESTVRRLRQKIEADPSTPRHVVSYYARGYRYEPNPAMINFPGGTAAPTAPP